MARAIHSSALRLPADANVAAVLSFGHPARRSDPSRRSADEWVARAKRKPYDEVVKEI